MVNEFVLWEMVMLWLAVLMVAFQRYLLLENSQYLFGIDFGLSSKLLTACRY